MYKQQLTKVSAMFIGFILLLSSCTKEDPIPNPTVTFIADLTNYDAKITVEATDATSYTWDYGDGKTSAESGNHTHTYAQSGDYTIKVSVTNASGTASKTVTVSVAASMTELLAGALATGKTWVLDDGASTNLQKIETALTLWTGLPAGALAAFGLQAEYDNKFKFRPDGGYEIDAVNGAVLTGLVYTAVNQLNVVVVPSSNAGGLAGAAFKNVTNGTYVLHEGKDLVIKVANEDYPAGTNKEGVKTITFPKANYITFSEGSFLGIRDFNTTVLLRNVTKDKIDATFFLSSIDPSNVPASFGLPSIAISTSIKVKP
jgi:PKD repeat protein